MFLGKGTNPQTRMKYRRMRDNESVGAARLRPPATPADIVGSAADRRIDITAPAGP
jgi:hypothetical protein